MYWDFPAGPSPSSDETATLGERLPSWPRPSRLWHSRLKRCSSRDRNQKPNPHLATYASLSGDHEVDWVRSPYGDIPAKRPHPLTPTKPTDHDTTLAELSPGSKKSLRAASASSTDDKEFFRRQRLNDTVSILEASSIPPSMYLILHRNALHRGRSVQNSTRPITRGCWPRADQKFNEYGDWSFAADKYLSHAKQVCTAQGSWGLEKHFSDIFTKHLACPLQIQY